MRLQELQKAYHAQPFRPFSIRVADGNEYRVVHPDFMAFSKRGRTVVVFTPADEMEIIDTALIVSVHVGNGRRKTI